MRIVLAVLSLVIAAISVGMDLRGRRSGETLCDSGLCRSDQLFANIDAQGITAASLSGLLEQDSSNPLVWCTYAETLARQGNAARAGEAFDRAVLLGPNMPPVLMRAANFAFVRGDRRKAWDLSRRILERTDAYDEILFSYLSTANAFTPELLGAAIPPSRAARAWISWLRKNGSDQAVSQSWDWMSRKRLCDRQSAVEVAWTLWERHLFRAAQQAWLVWLGMEGLGIESPGSGAGDYANRQQLGNRSFETEPEGGPFDWSLEVPESVAVSRNDGLEIRFLGTENVAFNHIRQTAVPRPGRYRFSAEIEAHELTTDQGPFFHIFDPVNAATVQVETAPIKGTVARSWITAVVTVPQAAGAVMVQLERRASERFDNKIKGTLHIYQVSLLPMGADNRQNFTQVKDDDIGNPGAH